MNDFNLKKSSTNMHNSYTMRINGHSGLHAYPKVIKLSKTYELSLTRQNNGFLKINSKQIPRKVITSK